MFSKKTLLLVVTAFAMVAAASSIAMAASKNQSVNITMDNVGVVDMVEVMAKHPGQAKAREDMANTARQLYNEGQAAIDKEKDQAKKAQIAQTQNAKLNEAQGKILAPLARDCEQAVRQVASAKKLVLVLSKDFVLIGGVDITQDVVQQLSKMAASSKKK